MSARDALRTPVIFFVISLATLGFSVRSALAGHAFGTVVSVEGGAYYSSPSLLRPTRLKGEETLKTATAVQTQLHSYVRILFDTAVLTVGEETLIEIAVPSERSVEGGLVVTLRRGVVRIVAHGSPERSVQVQVASVPDTVHFSEGSVVMWASESLSKTPEGGPMRSDTISNTGVANLDEHAVSWASGSASIMVPGGAVLTHRPTHRPILGIGRSAAAAPWIAKTEVRWTPTVEKGKKILQNLPNQRLLPILEARLPPHRHDGTLHTPPAVISGLVAMPPPAAVVAAAPGPSTLPSSPQLPNTPTGSSTSVTPVSVAPPILVAPASPPASTQIPVVPTSTSGLSGSGLPSFSDVIGAINGNGNAQGRGRR
jgi:hypothetical protein